MIKIRLQGKETEMNEVIKELDKIFEVLEVSGFYPNRNSKLGRVYVDVELNKE